MNPFRFALVGILGVVALFAVIASFYTVDEGHVGIVKRWGKAVSQVNPGLHFKVPFMDTVEHIEVRQRKNVEELAAATANQLPITAVVSINWTANKESAMSLFIKYGGLKQFEDRILDPKLRSAAKAALSKYRADQLIRDRQAAVATIMDNMVGQLEGFPVTINSPQIENVGLPPVYAEAVLQKEKARENAEREKHRLEQQRLVALQKVNTAEAEAQAKRLAADAEAYRIVTEAKASAEKVLRIGKELEAFPIYVEQRRNLQWNGALPRVVMSPDTDVLMAVGEGGVVGK